LLFGLVLFFNVSGVSAATTNSTITVKHTATTTTAAKQVTLKVNFSNNQISAASSKIKSYYEKYNKLPSYVAINNHKVTMPQFLQLLTDDIYLHNSEGSSTITLKTVKAPSKPTERLKTGTLTKTQYLNLVKSTRSYIYLTGKAPNNQKTSLGTIKFQNLVYTFSKIVKFQSTNKRLPNTVSVKPSTSTIAKTSSKVQSIVDSIGYAEAKFRDIQGQSSPSVMAKVGYGDCWADSGWLYNKLSAAGISVRIMGTTSGGIYYLHRWVEINVGSGWQTWNYAKYHSQHYSALGSGHFVVKSSV
jgi:hypothetical protein